MHRAPKISIRLPNESNTFFWWIGFFLLLAPFITEPQSDAKSFAEVLAASCFKEQWHATVVWGRPPSTQTHCGSPSWATWTLQASGSLHLRKRKLSETQVPFCSLNKSTECNFRIQAVVTSFFLLAIFFAPLSLVFFPLSSSNDRACPTSSSPLDATFFWIRCWFNKSEKNCVI